MLEPHVMWGPSDAGMYEQEGPEKASRGMGSPEDFEYMNAIRAAAR